jgi:hypothetical protein
MPIRAERLNSKPVFNRRQVQPVGTSDNFASVHSLPVWQLLQELAAGFPASDAEVFRV